MPAHNTAGHGQTSINVSSDVYRDRGAAATSPSLNLPALQDTPPVWTSTSFWVTIIPTISAVLGFFLHKQIDLSGQSASIALIAASIATGALAIARSMRHKAVLEANTRIASMRLDQWATMRHTVPAENVQAVFSEVEQDMRAHDRRLKVLEAASKPRAAKKTTPKKP